MILLFFLKKTLSEKETEARSLQEQTVQLQSELSRLRQDLQDKTTKEEQLRQQMNEKDEKTWKAIAVARSKIAQLSGNFM